LSDENLEGELQEILSRWKSIAPVESPPPPDPMPLRPMRSRTGSLAEMGWPRRALDVAAQADAREAVQAMAGWDIDTCNVAVLSGPAGTGKTVGAAAWALRRRELIAFVRASTFAASSRYDAEKRARWYEADGLCLDDLGAEYADTKGNFLVDLDELVDTFYADRRPLIITTNLTAPLFKARYGARIEDRIRECARWFVIGGESGRKAPPKVTP
jgi:DNA replication protein DnaC